MATSDFNVMDMLNDYAETENTDASELFKKPEPVKEEPKNKIPAQPEPSDGVVMDVTELKNELDQGLVNNAEEAWQEEGTAKLDDMKYTEIQIETAKKRHNISKLQIPPGEIQTRFIMAASDRNPEHAQANLDALFKELKELYPEMILEYIDASKAPVADSGDVTEIQPDDQNEESSVMVDDEKLSVVIDKTNVPDVSWTEEDLEKIKKARTIELNIVEKGNIEFGSVKKIRGNAVDKVLSKYQRKFKDVTKALPASKYRATFTGLTYPEVIDLRVSDRLNSFDAEMKKWTIAFNHTTNPSIGEWKEYIEYLDPNTLDTVQLPAGSDLPAGITEDNVVRITQFDDFMRHTSYLDLEYILWNILCATSMDSEVISIKCGNMLANGVKCNNVYDWVYRPSELLSIESIDPEILKDIEKVSTANSKEEILNEYNSSLVADNTAYVKLPSSGYCIFYGHASAYVYMNDLFGRFESISKASKSDDPDPSLVSLLMVITSLQIIKSIRVKNEDGEWEESDSVDDMIRILQTLDEIDWNVINKLAEILINPYTSFKYSIKGLVCKKCHTRSTIPVSDMTQLLFLVAQSLQSVQVKLTKN